MNIRTKEAAKYLGVSKSLLDHNRCYGGGPPYFKIGSAVVYSTDELDKWLEERRRTSTWGAANNNQAAERAA